MNGIEQEITIVQGYDTLSESQKTQFKQAIMEGLRGKFASTLQNDTDSMIAIINIWIKYGFLPMDQSFCAIDTDTGSVLAILLLNNFNKPGVSDSARCLLSVMRAIGVKKALKIAFHFLAIDNLNKEVNPENVKTEIYLVSTLAAQRGKGIGTYLIRRVLEYLHSEYACELARNADCRVKLLVFEKNPAIDLYDRLGFRRTSSVATPQIAGVFGNAYDVLVRMERPI